MSVELAAKVEKVLYEKVNRDRLDKILSAEELPEYLKVILNKYSKAMVNGLVPVSYSYSKSLKTVGRLYAKKSLSLQCIERAVRHYLSGEYYYDIDMANSCPVLIEQYCIKNAIKCPMLSRYVSERESILETIQNKYDIDRSAAKDLMLRLMFLGGYSYEKDGEEIKPKKSIAYLLDFKTELNKIATKISEKENKLYASVINSAEISKDKNPLASFLSIFYQTLENKCLMKMYEYFYNKSIDVGVLCFDGLMINKKNITDLDKLIKGCEDYVKTKTGYKIKLVEKPMDEEPEFEIPDYSKYVRSDLEAAKKLVSIVGKSNFKYCKDIFYIYDEDKGMYDSSPEVVFRYLDKYQEYFYKINKQGAEIGNYGTDSCLYNCIMPCLKTITKDDDWFAKVEKSSWGYLLFKDGVYDMNKGKFSKGLHNRGIVFFSRIPHKFPEHNAKNIKYAMDISFNRLFKDPSAMIRSLAMALAAKMIKKFYVCPGLTNAGKSKLLNMLQICFGEYVGEFNCESFAIGSKLDSKDEAAKLRWALLIKNCRIIMSSEMNMVKKLDGNMMKKFSGGDKIIGRTHGKEEISFTPAFTCFSLLNDITEITPLDDALYKRLEFLEFPYVFVDKDKVNKKPYDKVLDEDLDEKINSKKFISGFIHILLDSYKEYLDEGLPVYDLKIKKKWLAGSRQGECIIELINEKFNITKNYEKDSVTVSDMNKFRVENSKKLKGISATRFSEILVDELSITKGHKDNVRVYKGIKFI